MFLDNYQKCWLKTVKMYSVMVPEVRTPKSNCCQVWLLLEALRKNSFQASFHILAVATNPWCSCVHGLLSWACLWVSYLFWGYHSLDLGATQMYYGAYLNLISAKTTSKWYHIHRFQRSGLEHTFWGNTVQPTALAILYPQY